MSTAFGAGADFTAMFERRDASLDAVIHQARLQVDEEGTEAAAATAVLMKRVSAQPPFRADHPFLFLIRDLRTGSILFLGRFVGP